jgi:hypothetical protein
MVVRMGRGVLYHLHKARWWLSAGVYSVSYTRQVGGRLQMAGVYTVSYMSVGCV